MNIIDANIVDVVRKEIFPARISFDTHIRQIEPLSEIINNKYILPGLVDAHVHIESSMLPPSEFARIAVRHGTLAVVADPHEIANVLGIGGIDFMIKDTANVPFRFVFGAPSCVPATPFETSGAIINDEDIEKLFQNGCCSFLSEMMNFPGVINKDEMVMKKIKVAHKLGKIIDGHSPGLTGEALQKYISADISTDHECSTYEEAEEKIRLGMKILIREGSAAKNFDALYSLIDRFPEMIMLCTDDIHPDDLLRGHINSLIKKAVEKGVNLFSLLRAATLVPIKHYQIDLGLVQLNDPADFIIVDDLHEFNITKSFFRGVCLYDRVGEKESFANSREKSKNRIFPNQFDAEKITISDLKVISTSCRMKVIQVFDGELFTKEFFYMVPKGLPILSNTDADILKIVVLNRYKPEKPAVGFVRGFGLKKGALVSTVAHDSHHIIAVGCDDNSLVQVINYMIVEKGGLAAYYQNNLISLKLDIAGLMSSASADEVASAYEQINKAALCMGSSLKSPLMTLSFMALLVIPELKIGVKGLFDVNKFEWTELFV